MKEVGWEFATHSWGHKDMGEASYDNMVTDMEKWLDQVNPLLGGDTDIESSRKERILAAGEAMTTMTSLST